jgi:arylsulfatase
MWTPRFVTFRRLVVAAGAAACFAVTCSACHPAASPRLNVLIILVDALRADHLGAYGYGRPTSPAFDALANRGSLFTRAHSVTSWTDPAIESLFTGQYPRVLQPGAPEFIAPDVQTLAASFHNHGYSTGAIVASPVVAPALGFARGFDTYVGVSGWQHSLAPHPKEPAERVNGAAREWLAQQSTSAPWFLYLHYMDTHWPYTPPLDTIRRFWHPTDGALADAVSAINTRVGQRASDLSADEAPPLADLYDAAIAHFDTQLGQLLEALESEGRLSNTVLCIIADHGEELGDHGGVRHARTLYEEVLRIPLLMVVPNVAGPARVDRLVRITDVGRTLLDAAGIDSSTFPGRSLLRPSTTSPEEPSFAELMPGFLTGAIHQYALIDGDMKLIVPPGSPPLLFDLRNDPGETHSVSADHQPLVEELSRALNRMAVRREWHVVSTPDAATRERLHSLGYDF